MNQSDGQALANATALHGLVQLKLATILGRLEGLYTYGRVYGNIADGAADSLTSIQAELSELQSLVGGAQ